VCCVRPYPRRGKAGVESTVSRRCDVESVARVGIVKGVISYFCFIEGRKWELKRKITCPTVYIDLSEI
jgi:hypothetical protein